MTLKTPGSRITLIRRREPIRADWLNQVASLADRHARSREEASGEGEEGAQEAITLTEVPGTAVWGAPFRIEDASDPTVYIETQNKIEISLTDENGVPYKLELEDDQPP